MIKSKADICESANPQLGMGDEAEKIFINPHSTREGLDGEFAQFLDYLKGGKAKMGLTAEIEKAVEKARLHKEWEVEYMTWQAFEMDAKREGRAEGRAEGIISIGRRHGFDDNTIIEDMMSETGCSRAEAQKLLENYGREPEAVEA